MLWNTLSVYLSLNIFRKCVRYNKWKASCGFQVNLILRLSSCPHMAQGKDRGMLTFTLSAPILILPHDTASSGRAPASLPSNSWAVLI